MPESELYEPIQSYLQGAFPLVREGRWKTNRRHASITATLDWIEGGTWMRPDLALVHVHRRNFDPAPTLDLYTFEVKASGANALRGERVLALDLDPQANLSWALLGPSPFENHASNATMTRWLQDITKGRKGAFAATLELVGVKKGGRSYRAKGDRAELRLAVSNTRLRFEEMKFEGPIENDPALVLSERLNEALDQLSQSFDYCVMDCSPALSALTRAGLRIADSIIVPTPLNALCLESLETFRTVGVRELLGLKTPIFVMRTRVGAAMGKLEQNRIVTRLVEREADRTITLLRPDFVESVDYMRALNPPETGSVMTLSTKYGARVADLEGLALSLKDRGVI